MRDSGFNWFSGVERGICWGGGREREKVPKDVFFVVKNCSCEPPCERVSQNYGEGGGGGSSPGAFFLLLLEWVAKHFTNSSQLMNYSHPVGRRY